MKTSNLVKISVVMAIFLAFVVAQNQILAPKPPEVPAVTPVETPNTSQLMTAAEPAPVAFEPAPVSASPQEAPAASPASSINDEGNIAAIDSSGEQAIAERSLATLERIRALPEAAPLVDEIVALLQNNPYKEFSMDNLVENEDGLVELNEDTLRQMIRNDDVRAKWMKLMGLIAKNPELVATIQGGSEE